MRFNISDNGTLPKINPVGIMRFLQPSFFFLKPVGIFCKTVLQTVFADKTTCKVVLRKQSKTVLQTVFCR